FAAPAWRLAVRAPLAQEFAYETQPRSPFGLIFSAPCASSAGVLEAPWQVRGGYAKKTRIERGHSGEVTSVSHRYGDRQCCEHRGRPGETHDLSRINGETYRFLSHTTGSWRI